MCLIVKIDKFNPTAHLRTAEVPIECYKIVKKLKGKYMTPFQEVRLRWTTMKGLTTLKAKGEKIECKNVDSFFDDTNLYVYDGAIHTMAKLEEVQDFIQWIRDEEKALKLHTDVKYEIWRCVIPTGTKYMVGEDFNLYSCLGSKRIRFVEKLAETEDGEKTL